MDGNDRQLNLAQEEFPKTSLLFFSLVNFAQIISRNNFFIIN